MKRFFTLVFLLGIFSSSLIGCAHNRQICIKVVDAQTRTPLAGVQTTWRQDRSDLFRGSAHIAPTNLPPSGPDGIIRVEAQPGVTWKGSFIFSCPGCQKLYGFYAPKYLNLAETVDDEDGDFVLEQPIVSAAVTNGCFIVPMAKKNRTHSSEWLP
ncbi:hypothetical protein Cflav_PD4764 [Pedosphaera parvula Ellin514]|uniref:Lipoprotein n=1 Tax=Pedosphaera parvula (strain Ellin514) TaxID=320771 RepID=B9XEL0_PEDPL|nr:hypothetical protein Cflav_PD4764 [Pedosphaera parvula Ellin514]